MISPQDHFLLWVLQNLQQEMPLLSFLLIRLFLTSTVYCTILHIHQFVSDGHMTESSSETDSAAIGAC